jgi:hypothetical protein
MNNPCSCLYCKKEFPSKGLFTHVYRAHLKLYVYSSGNNGKYKEISENNKIKKQKLIEQYMLSPSKCGECNSNLIFEKRYSKFCNHSCSATFGNRKRAENGWRPSLEQKKKTSETLTGEIYKPPVVIKITCKECQREFDYVKYYTYREKTFCSKSCSTKFSNKKRNEIARNNRSALINYRSACAFKFSVKDYPEEFDFSLIEQYGWYKAKNNGDNLQGVSRDHMVSIRYGFDNNLPSEHLSHPANCKLIRHGDNVSKGTKNSITYETLLKRIEDWDKKYNTTEHHKTKTIVESGTG